MIIVGAKGFAKEVLEVIHQSGDLDNVVFFDDVSPGAATMLYGMFPVLRTLDEAKNFIRETGDFRFTLGIGNPAIRHQLYHKFMEIGGVFTSTLSPFARVGNYGNSIAEGCNIMTGTVITNDISIGKGALINLNCTIGHDTVMGEFVEMSPGVHVSGNCRIGNYCNLGTNSTLLPKIQLGQNVIVGAGSVVTKDVPDNSLVVGVPAVIKKQLPPLGF